MESLKKVNYISNINIRVLQKNTASFFTIYLTENCVELHSGFTDYPSYQIYCTCFLYETALKIAYLLANTKNIPLKNYICKKVAANCSEGASSPREVLAVGKVS